MLPASHAVGIAAGVAVTGLGLFSVLFGKRLALRDVRVREARRNAFADIPVPWRRKRPYQFREALWRGRLVGAAAIAIGAWIIVKSLP